MRDGQGMRWWAVIVGAFGLAFVGCIGLLVLLTDIGPPFFRTDEASAYSAVGEYLNYLIGVPSAIAAAAVTAFLAFNTWKVARLQAEVANIEYVDRRLQTVTRNFSQLADSLQELYNRARVVSDEVQNAGLEFRRSAGGDDDLVFFRQLKDGPGTDAHAFLLERAGNGPLARALASLGDAFNDLSLAIGDVAAEPLSQAIAARSIRGECARFGAQADAFERRIVAIVPTAERAGRLPPIDGDIAFLRNYLTFLSEQLSPQRLANAYAFLPDVMDYLWFAGHLLGHVRCEDDAAGNQFAYNYGAAFLVLISLMIPRDRDVVRAAIADILDDDDNRFEQVPEALRLGPQRASLLMRDHSGLLDAVMGEAGHLVMLRSPAEVFGRYFTSEERRLFTEERPSEADEDMRQGLLGRALGRPPQKRRVQMELPAVARPPVTRFRNAPPPARRTAGRAAGRRRRQSPR